MQDLNSIHTWCDFGTALGNEVKRKGFTLATVGHGVIYPKGRGKVTTSCISRATYFRVINGQSRPPVKAVTGILKNLQMTEFEICQWVACWERLMAENAATANILEKAAAQADVLKDRVDSPGAAAQHLMEMILRRRTRLAAMRSQLGANHPYVVTFGFDTACYVRALIEPDAVRGLLLTAIKNGVHVGHGRPRRFGTAEKLLGQIDEHLMMINAIEEELLVRDAEIGYSQSPQHDPFQKDFAELTQPTKPKT